MKSNWKDSIKKYSLESRNFDNYDGGGKLPIKDNFIGQRGSNFIGESKSTGYANGQNALGGDTFSQIDDSDKYYTIIMTNTATSGGTSTAVAFGANQYGISADQASGATVTVTVEESSHTQARAQSLSKPFWVNGLRYSVDTVGQLSQLITIQYQSASGDLVQKKFRPNVFKTASQNQSLQIDAPGYKFGVDGNTQIQVPLLANEEVTLILQIGGEYDPSKAVQGQSPLAVASQRELATGIVTVVR